MPKKAAKKATKKVTKKTTKKVAVKTALKKSAPKKTTSSGTGLNKKYLHKETEEFYAAHPNVKSLLILFLLIASAVFIYLVKLRTATALM